MRRSGTTMFGLFVFVLAAPLFASLPPRFPGYPLSDVVRAAARRVIRGAELSAGAGSYVAVWRELDLSQQQRIKFSRLDARGVPLSDPQVINLGPAKFLSDLDITFDGDDHFLVWVADQRLVGGRLGLLASQFGLVNNFAPDVAGRFYDARVAWNGDRFLIIARMVTASGPRLIGLLVARDGTLIRPQVAIPSQSTTLYDVTAAPSGFLVTALGTDGVTAIRLSAGAEVLDPSPIVLDPLPESYRLEPRIARPASVTDGSSSLVVWTRRPGSGPSEVRATLLSSDGIVQREETIERGASPIEYPDAHVVWNGSDYVIGWTKSGGSEQDAWAATVSRNGSILSTPTFIHQFAGTHRLAAFQTTGSSAVALITESVPKSFLGADLKNLLSVAIHTPGPPAPVDPSSPGTLVSTQQPDQTSIRLKSTPTGFVAAWQEFSADRGSIVAARIGADGKSLDRYGVPIATLTTVPTGPAIAFDGNHTLVVWFDGDRMYGARFSIWGQRIDEPQLLHWASATPRAIDAVWNGRVFVILWAEEGSLFVKTIDPLQGLLSSSPIPIRFDTAGRTNYGARFPRIASAADGTLLVVFSTFSLSPCPTGPCRQSFRATAMIVRLGDQLRIGSPLDLGSQATAVSQTVAVTGSQDSFFVAWSNGIEVRAARVDTGGQVTTPPGGSVIFASGQSIRDVEIVKRPDDLLVAWQELDPHLDHQQILYRVVSLGGQPQSNARRLGVEAPAQSPEAALGPDGRVLITYETVIRATGAIRGYAHFHDESIELSRPPEPPSHVTYTWISPTQVRVRWRDESESEMGFIVEIETSPGNYSRVAEAGPGVTEATIGVYGGEPRIRVRSFHSGGASVPSAVATETRRSRAVIRP